MKHRNQMRRYAAAAYARGMRVYAELDIAKARDEAQNILARIQKKRGELAEKQLTCAKESEKRALRDAIARDAQRYDDLMGAVRLAEGEQGARVAAGMNRKLEQREVSRKAMIGSMYKSLMRAVPIEATVRAELQLPTVTDADNGGRSVLLPRTRSEELIRDFFEDDSFLSEITVTMIKGLELPRITSEDTEEDDDVPEGEDAPEMSLTEGMISWGRYRYSKCVEVPSSLLAETDTALAQYIDERHANLMRVRMCKRIFDDKSNTKYAHMSVYDQTEVKVTRVSASTELDGIVDALAALPTTVRANAKVALTPVKWMRLIRELANGATALFGAPDPHIIGFTPVLCDYATKTIVGDLRTIHLNYDSPITVESERHARKGTTDIVLSTHYDIQIEQPGALRVVDVTSTMSLNAGPATPMSQTLGKKPGDDEA